MTKAADVPKNGQGTTTHATLAKALVAAQAEMPAVEPDGENPHFKSKFVTLGHLLAKARPVLNRHGLAVAQFPSVAVNGDGGGQVLVTRIMHESGEKMEYAAPLLLTKNDPQGQGSAITYMRRYALASALGISDQEDDDGNAGSTPQDASSAPPGVTEKQADLLVSLAKQHGASDAEQETVRAYALENLTGGKQGTASQSIEKLKTEGPEFCNRMVSAALAWQAGQSDVPADMADLLTEPTA